MHLIIYFSGTGCHGEKDDGGMLQFQEVEGVSTISVRGCTDSEVCNEGLFPNLEEFAHRFVESVFRQDTDGNLMLVDTNFSHLKVDIRSDGTTAEPNQNSPIDTITLCGYSRGAVTCFNVARELQKMVSNVEVNIVADQPVPGNIYVVPGSIASSVEDCTDLTNLKNVSVILGTYTEDGITKEYVQAGILREIIIAANDAISNTQNIDETLKAEAKKVTTNALNALAEKSFTEGDSLADVIDHLKDLELIAIEAGIGGGLLDSIALAISSYGTGVANFVQKMLLTQIVPTLPSKNSKGENVHQEIIAIPHVSHVSSREHVQLEVSKVLHRCDLVEKNLLMREKPR